MALLRIWPRAMISLYGAIFWYTTNWYMELPDPSGPQAAFVSTIVGAGAAWFGLYVSSGNNDISIRHKPNNIKSDDTSGSDV